MNLPRVPSVSSGLMFGGIDSNGIDVRSESRSKSYPSVGSRALLAAKGKKARVVTFYRNGRQFDHSVRVSFVVGKTFPHMDALMDFLTEKCPDIAYGVRYIFTLTGRMVVHVDELQHNMCYVMSGIKQFHFVDYGLTEREIKMKNSESSTSVVSYSGSDGPLLGTGIGSRYQNGNYYRSADNLMNGMYFNGSNNFNGGDSSNTSSLNSTSTSSQSTGVLNGLPSRKTDGKIITLINTANPSIKSRVLLNLRTPKSFESVLKDLGDAVKMSNPRKLFTEAGYEVTCISK